MSARFFSPESPRVLIRNSPITGPVHTLRVSIGPCCPFLFGAGPHAACANSPIHPLFSAGPHVACAGSPIHAHHSRYTRCACRFVHSPISGPVHTLRTPICSFPIMADPRLFALLLTKQFNAILQGAKRGALGTLAPTCLHFKSRHAPPLAEFLTRAGGASGGKDGARQIAR